MCAIYSTHLIFLEFIIKILSGEVYKHTEMYFEVATNKIIENIKGR